MSLSGVNTSAAAVEVTNLVKKFGDVTAVNGIDLRVERGETFGFLGPNGAGKSTTISILCTLLDSTSGHAKVAGHDVVKERDDVRRNIGLVFQDPTLDVYLTAEQNLRFHAELYGVPRDVMKPRLKQVLEMVGLWERRDGIVQTFSGGMKRRLEIARGLMHSPRVLFLDEPTVGLDPQTRASIWGYLDQLRQAEDITIFVTTHYMDEADNCDRIAIMDHGQIVAIDTPTQLKAQVGNDRVEVRTPDNTAAAVQLAERFSVDATVVGDVVVLSVPDGEQFVPKLFSQYDGTIQAVAVFRPSLDDVFMSHTGRDIRESDAPVRGMGMPPMMGRR